MRLETPKFLDNMSKYDSLADKYLAKAAEVAEQIRSGKLNDEKVESAFKSLDEYVEERTELNKTNYVPTPYDITTSRNSKKVKLNVGIDIAITKETTSTPFMQINPILNHRLLNWNKSGIGSECTMKLFLYIASIIKRNCNYVYFTREQAIKYINITNRSFAVALSNLIKMDMLVPVDNAKSFYVINHNMIYNGSKSELNNWVMANYAKRHLEFIDKESRSTTCVIFDNVYRDFVRDRIRKQRFEPFEE